MGDKSIFGIECIISRIFPHLQSKMDSNTSSKSNLSESSSWDFDTMCQNSAKMDELMLDMKQSESVQCSVCNKQKDTLARREEIAWQREEIIHTREKEMREWELMLEEKSRLLNEKEKQLKYDEEKFLQIDAVHNSEKNSRKSSLSDIGLCTFTVEHTKENIKKDVLEREKLLQKKEKVMTEKFNNFEKKEQNVVMQEQQLNKQRILFNKEREIVAQRNHSLDLREQVVKKIEKAVESKLKVINEQKKSLEEGNNLLTQRENALSIATEYIENKEQTLNERENKIIEKERNIIKKICDMKRHTGSESLGTDNELLFKEFDGIFDEKWKSIRERENSIVNSEQILQEKWKEYSEAKELLKSEEENLHVMMDTFEKEKNMLREWEKHLEKRGEEIEQKHESTRCSSDKSRTIGDESVGAWPTSHDVQTKEDSRMNKSSPFGAVGQLLNGNKTGELSREIPNLENREISGDELFRFYEKEKESYQALLLNENAPTNNGESNNSNRNKELTKPVQAFFKSIRASPSFSDSKSEQIVDKREINKTSHLSLDSPGERSIEVREDILNESVALSNQNESSVSLGNSSIQETCSDSPKKSILLQMFNKESDENSTIVVASDLEINTTEKTLENNGSQPSGTLKVDGNDGSTSENSTESPNSQENGSISQKIRKNTSTDNEEIENESSVKNGNDLGKTSPEISNVCVSPTLSASSKRSSPLSGRGSPWLGKNKRKPAKDALLQAISKRNFLETVQLLDTNCMSLEVRNDEGRSAALLAVECGNIELLERLINKGADMKACDYKGHSALHIAVAENNSEMVLYLLKKGLNPRVTDINGNSAVKLASNLKYLNLAEIMNDYIVTIST